MNKRQKKSVASFCYNMSQAIHIGWMIALATGKITWWAACILLLIGVELFIVAYKKEA